MQVIDSIHLPTKFDPYIINNMNNDLKNQLDQIFQNLQNPSDPISQTNGFQPIGGKEHVVTHPNLPKWVIKGPRHDDIIYTLPDTHIYRVRRATRIQKVIDKRGFSEEVVPQKFLYEYRGQWFVIAQELDIDSNATLDPNVAMFDSKRTLKSLTPKQAEEVAYLCFEGKLEDVNVDNLHFTKSGKIAILDTEPIGRAMKKAGKFWFRLIPNLKSTVQFMTSMVNSERLFLMCNDDEAGKKVRQVQSRMLWKYVGKITAKIALPLIFSVGALIGAIASANPLLVGIAGTAVAGAGIYAVIGLGLIALSALKYCIIRSPMGQYQLAG